MDWTWLSFSCLLSSVYCTCSVLLYCCTAQLSLLHLSVLLYCCTVQFSLLHQAIITVLFRWNSTVICSKSIKLFQSGAESAIKIHWNYKPLLNTALLFNALHCPASNCNALHCTKHGICHECTYISHMKKVLGQFFFRTDAILQTSIFCKAFMVFGVTICQFLSFLCVFFPCVILTWEMAASMSTEKNP